MAPTGAARLLAGAQVAAPDGARAYCARYPDQCVSAFSDELRGRVEATGAASFQRATLQSREAQQASVFEAMVLTRVSTIDASALEGRAEMPLTPARLAQLRAVNRDINRAIRPLTDRAGHGVEEVWSMPLSTGGPGARGDCEDYALEKRARLIALGWSADMLSLAVAHAPNVGLHAVLIAQTSEGDYVLDNLYREPQPLARLPYLWISRQRGASLSDWAVAHQAQFTTRAPLSFEQMMNARLAQSPAATASAATETAAPPTTQSAPVTPAAPKPDARTQEHAAPARVGLVRFEDDNALCTRRRGAGA